MKTTVLGILMRRKRGHGNVYARVFGHSYTRSLHFRQAMQLKRNGNEKETTRNMNYKIGAQMRCVPKKKLCTNKKLKAGQA